MRMIELSDDQAAALTTKAAAQGLSLEDKPLQTVADIILKRMRGMPASLMAAMPKDGATQRDYYIYGLPKKEG
jgi:hypothetical protein